MNGPGDTNERCQTGIDQVSAGRLIKQRLRGVLTYFEASFFRDVWLVVVTGAAFRFRIGKYRRHLAHFRVTRVWFVRMTSECIEHTRVSHA